MVTVGQLLKSEGENTERTKEQMYFFVVTLVVTLVTLSDRSRTGPEGKDLTVEILS